MSTWKPCVTVGPLPGRLGELVPILEAGGCEVLPIPARRHEDGFTWSDQLVDEFIRPADALVGTFAGMRLDRAVIEAAERVRVITSPIIGTEHIDVEASTEAGIVVAFGAIPENTVGVAEAVVMLAAALRHQLPQKAAAAADGSWRPAFAGHLIRESTIGLIGFGAIARQVVDRLSGWEVARILAADPYVDDDEIIAGGAEPTDLTTLLARSDIVSVMVTLTEETSGLIGPVELAAMKPGAGLINAARGGVIDERALLDALDNGTLGGAAIDTWEFEGPGSESPLRNHPRVIATGHNVGHSEELYDRHPPAAAENTLRALRGETPLHVRNPSVLPAWRARIERLAGPRPSKP